MVSSHQVVQARRKIASVLGINYEHVGMEPDDSGGVNFSIATTLILDSGDIVKLREAISSETGLSSADNVRVSSDDHGEVNNILVLSSSYEDAAERVACMDASRVTNEAFPGRRF